MVPLGTRKRKKQVRIFNLPYIYLYMLYILIYINIVSHLAQGTDGEVPSLTYYMRYAADKMGLGLRVRPGPSGSWGRSKRVLRNGG